MRNVPLFLAVFLLGIAMLSSAEDGLYIDIDDMSTTQGSIVGEASSLDGDDEDGSAMLSDEGSGESGSGESTIDTQTTHGTTAKPTDMSAKAAKSTERPNGERTTKATKSSDEITAAVASEIISTQEQDKSTKELTVDPNDDVNAMARSDPEEKVLRVLTTEVIAAVVVGAVCAVILIAFLVYRLRKRDEGSYPLSDSSYKDTYKLRGETGKEAFV